MANKYKKFTHIEHILARPDTYIGSTSKDTSAQWVFKDEAKTKLVEKMITFVPGLYKIYDEILVNAIDQCSVDDTLDKIHVEITNEYVSITNTGKGVPIEKHPDHDVYVPEMIFGELLTSSNYDDTQERTTGGRNGYGAKLANVFSTRFIIDTVSPEHGKRYVQEWTNNMSVKSKPSITSKKSKGYTKITFYPDSSKLGGLDTDTIALFEKRVYDMCACTPEKVKIHLNNKAINIKNFEKYTELYIGSDKTERQRIQEQVNARWTVVVTPSNDAGFKHVSFVNGICTYQGGSHVDSIVSQLVKMITEYLQTKHKNLTVKPSYIKDHLFIFVKTTLVNPTFSSQTKSECTSRYKDFGSRNMLSEDFIKKIVKMNFIQDIISLSKHKESQILNKSDGKKVTVIKIPKLDDANKAGTRESNKCTLILSEGDSAKTFCISGLSVIGRDYYGVFPLRGKMLNVRDATSKQLVQNEELNNIKKILGLQQGKVYTDTNQLRYGKVCIMTDADNDGSHIKGLFINYIHHFWPALLVNTTFIISMRTPIVKITKGVSFVKEFFTKQEYDQWARSKNLSTYHIKYLKGLGSSTSNDAKEYFKTMKENTVQYVFNGKESDDNMALAFKKDLTNERKKWIQEGTKRNDVLDIKQNDVSISDFINKELIWFSIADNVRSIPHIMDSLKPSQRKILFISRKRGLYKDMKVSQLAGYVSAETAYHHGETSLCGTIINMSQDFVGSNNINLLLPHGQMGTRLMGGKDAASPRYVFTQLSPKVEHLFHKHDDALLNMLEDDGMKIEPEFFVPTLPLVLINSVSGIGTGYSTFIPSYNPKDIKNNILRILNGKEPKEMVPWYKNFKGVIEKIETHKYTTKGVWKMTGDTSMEITELPISSWISDYKEFLDKLLDDVVKSYENHSTESDVLFKIELFGNRDYDDIEKQFKLITNLNTSNMHLFNTAGIITKYESPLDILKEYLKTKLDFYGQRKAYLIKSWSDKRGSLYETSRFIQYVMDDKIVVFKQNKASIVEQLTKHAFLETMFDHFLGLKLHVFTSEKLSDMNETICALTNQIEELQGKTECDMWTSDLEKL
jgi:DNA topoisomerase-2